MLQSAQVGCSAIAKTKNNVQILGASARLAIQITKNPTGIVLDSRRWRAGWLLLKLVRVMLMRLHGGCFTYFLLMIVMVMRMLLLKMLFLLLLSVRRVVVAGAPSRMQLHV